MNRWMYRAVAVAAATATLFLAACSKPSDSTAGGRSDGKLTTVTVRHSWLPDDLLLPIVAAKHMGFYEKEGIVVVDQIGNGGAVAAQLVANGNVMIGVGEAANVLNARKAGLPIVNIATQMQDQPNALVTMKSSGINGWKDLVGKRIGTTTTSSGHVGLLATLKKQGIAESDVNLVNFPPGAALTTLPSGRIDAAGTFLGNIASVDFQDKLNVLTYSDGGFKAPSSGYFVREDTLVRDKDLLVRWLRATLKGLRYAIDNPAEAAKYLASEYANVKVENITAMWKLNSRFIDTPAIVQHGLGYQDPTGWDALKEALVATKSIGADLDVSKAFTTQILDQIPRDQRS